MKSRIDKVADWGFDWVEFDNMDWVFDDEYRKEYGFMASKAVAKGYFPLDGLSLLRGRGCENI